jgi:exopolyphosphatase/pppGpp-phosphohydrolase
VADDHVDLVRSRRERPTDVVDLERGVVSLSPSLAEARPVEEELVRAVRAELERRLRDVERKVEATREAHLGGLAVARGIEVADPVRAAQLVVEADARLPDDRAEQKDDRDEDSGMKNARAARWGRARSGR